MPLIKKILTLLLDNHTRISWDLMIDIVEYIENIYDEKHGYFKVEISSNNCTIVGTNFRSDNPNDVYFNSVYANTKKEAVIEAIVSFALWIQTINI